jgi:hypothetical protein
LEEDEAIADAVFSGIVDMAVPQGMGIEVVQVITSAVLGGP